MGAAILLSACTVPGPAPLPSGSPSPSAEPSETPTPTPVPVVVPDLAGKPVDAARNALDRIGLIMALRGDGGVVTKQSPKAGTTLLTGQAVTLTVRHYVRYEATGSFGRAWMQWTPPGSSRIVVDEDVPLPWSKTWWDTTDYGHVVVGTKAVFRGTASCRIIVDGKVVSKQSVKGLTPNVTCG